MIETASFHEWKEFRYFPFFLSFISIDYLATSISTSTSEMMEPLVFMQIESYIYAQRSFPIVSDKLPD